MRVVTLPAPWEELAMGLLRDLFGPSKEEVWSQLAKQIGADFTDRGFWGGGGIVRAQVGEWTVTLDTYTVSRGKHRHTYTRLRAPFVNADGFRFQVYRDNFLWKIGKAFGMQDVEVGHAEFDDAFVIRGSDESRLRQLFADDQVRDLLRRQPEVCFEVRDDEGFFATKFPQGVDELHFRVRGVVTDVARLRALFDLFAATLDRLTRIGSAYRRDPGVRL